MHNGDGMCGARSVIGDNVKCSAEMCHCAQRRRRQRTRVSSWHRGGGYLIMAFVAVMAPLLALQAAVGGVTMKNGASAAVV